MLFVNAKINIGLQIVSRRADGYHNLQTVFYPIGVRAGTPENPVPFCDLLELTPSASGYRFVCDSSYPAESNLANRAAQLFFDRSGVSPDVTLILEKHIPDGAGIGGGSADAAFTLRMLNDRYDRPFSDAELMAMALELGADCPFFILNRPAYAEGVGERMEEMPLDLDGYELLLVRPHLRVSTREAFALVKPHAADFDLRQLPELPVENWRELVHNDFEDSLFPQFPVLAELKQLLYDNGAVYASLTGSGSCLYGLFAAGTAPRLVHPAIATTYLLKI